MSKKKRRIITVDGLSGSGKTTISKLLAERINYIPFSSGVIYRAIGWKCLEDEININNEELVTSLAKNIKLEITTKKDNTTAIMLNNKDVSNYLYTPQVSEASSLVARYPDLRKFLIDIQRQAFNNFNIVAEGRDMGTVIFPYADIKFFITVREDIRLKRRAIQRGLSAKEIEKEMTARDKRDLYRTVSPVKPAIDAIVIDNSIDDLKIVLDNMLKHIKAKGLV